MMNVITKSFTVIIAIFAIFAAVSTSCAKSAKLDIDGINELVHKGGEDISISDRDFILDQIEIVSDNVGDLNDEEKVDYFNSLSEEERQCIYALAIMGENAAAAGVFTDKQLKRYNKLMEKTK